MSSILESGLLSPRHFTCRVSVSWCSLKSVSVYDNVFAVADGQ